MLKLLERHIASVDTRLVLLAPPETQWDWPAVFPKVDVDPESHQRLIQEVQRLRGSIYLNDGAINLDQLSHDGLHRTPEDDKSWHLLMLNGKGGISACTWYRQHTNKVYFQRLRLRNCPLATMEDWCTKLWKAVESEIASARQAGLHYAEIGGWAVTKESRCTADGIVLALTAYALGRISGGTLGITTATVRHHSASILKRIGGQHLEVDGSPVPPYYDPHYRCVMEILRFDSRQPSTRFSHLIEMLCDKLAEVRLIAKPLWPMPQLGERMQTQPQPLCAA
jgi:hypothetical protein